MNRNFEVLDRNAGHPRVSRALGDGNCSELTGYRLRSNQQRRHVPTGECSQAWQTSADDGDIHLDNKPQVVDTIPVEPVLISKVAHCDVEPEDANSKHEASRPQDGCNGCFLGEPYSQWLQEPDGHEEEHDVGKHVQGDQCPVPSVDVNACSQGRGDPGLDHRRASVKEGEGTHHCVCNDDGEHGVDGDIEAFADGESEIEGQDGRLGEEDREVVGDGDGEEADNKVFIVQ